MNSSELSNLGITHPAAQQLAMEYASILRSRGYDAAAIQTALTRISLAPMDHLANPESFALAQALCRPAYTPRATLAPWQQWGRDLDPEAIKQMVDACALPITYAGALMPDAHVGYGLPIGGVLATENAVIPYAVGMDIACRMRLTIYERKANVLAGQKDRLANILESETCFGMGQEFATRRHHDIMDEDWSITPVTQQLHEKAWRQLGSSGSGNHFVEFGSLTVTDTSLGIPEGSYLALLSHSGSRGAGAKVCEVYSRRALDRCQSLPSALKRLSWLSLDDADGQEYWAAMNLMGHYAAANHAVIHKQITKKVGARVALTVENHHNFAWKEIHDGREVIVHRKGATPADAGTLGIIPGSMATPGYLVRGRGHPGSLHSASHGAGRVMSRAQAMQSVTWSATRKQLKAAGVELLSAGLDEVPAVYKDIETVMAAQTDLVDVLGRFDPRIVKMSPPGERAQD